MCMWKMNRLPFSYNEYLSAHFTGDPVYAVFSLPLFLSFFRSLLPFQGQKTDSITTNEIERIMGKKKRKVEEKARKGKLRRRGWRGRGQGGWIN